MDIPAKEDEVPKRRREKQAPYTVTPSKTQLTPSLFQPKTKPISCLHRHLTNPRSFAIILVTHDSFRQDLQP